MSFTNRKIRIKAKTWNRDSYGLFDYETTNYHLQNIDVSKPGRLSRFNNEVTCQSQYPLFQSKDSITEETSKTHQGPEILTLISQESEGIKITVNSSEGDGGSQMWMAVDKSSGVHGLAVSENDTIKLGRVIFRIKQICLEDGRNMYKPPDELIIDSLKEYMVKRDEKNPEKEEEDPETKRTGEEGPVVMCCKICLGDKGEEDDPLISPCKCIGSVKFVHLKCLQNWVKSKLNIEQAQKLISIFWKQLSCELCKSELPLYLNYQGSKLLLLPVQNKMPGPYVVLESFSKEKEPCGIHLIDLSSKQSFRIGRSHECELKLSDISVSRVHAILKVNQGKLFLKDNYSKFGTLVLIRDSIILNDANAKSPWIQCGRTVLKFSIKKPWSVVIPCLGSIFGISKLCEANPDRNSEKNKGQVLRERLHTNYEDTQREGTPEQS